MKYEYPISSVGKYFGLPQAFMRKIQQEYQIKALQCLRDNKRVNIMGIVVLKLEVTRENGVKTYSIEIELTKIVRDWLELYNTDKSKARKMLKNGG